MKVISGRLSILESLVYRAVWILFVKNNLEYILIYLQRLEQWCSKTNYGTAYNSIYFKGNFLCF